MGEGRGRVKARAKVRGARVVPALVVAGALTAGAAPAGAQQEAPDPRLPSVELPAELDRVLRDYEAAWAAGDGPALAALFTEDGVVRRRNWIRGREAIAARYSRVAGGDLRLRAVDAHAGETAGWILGAYGYGARAAERDGGLFVLALERGPDGRWLIAADLDHGVPPG